MGSSSVNNFKGIKAGLASMKKTNSDFKEIKALEKQKSDILQKQAKGEALTDADNAILKKWDDLGSQGYSEKALAKASDYNEGQFLKSELSQAKASKNKVAIKDAKTNLKNYNAEHSLYQNAKTTVQNGVNSLKDTNIAKALKGLKDLSNTDKLKMIGYGIDADVTNIINAMNQGVPANTLVAQYGYNNVAQVINAVVGTTYADQAI